MDCSLATTCFIVGFLARRLDLHYFCPLHLLYFPAVAIFYRQVISQPFLFVWLQDSCSSIDGGGIQSETGFKCNPWAIKKLSGLQLRPFICLCHADPSAARVLPFPFLDIDSNVFSGPTLCLPAGGAPSNTAVDVYPVVFLWAWSHCSRAVTWVGWGWKICETADCIHNMLTIDYLFYKTPGIYKISIGMFLSPSSIFWAS